MVNGFAVSEKDDINPFEQVEVYAPTESVYEVRVKGVQVVQAHTQTQGQPYSLVVTGNFAKTGELYPNAAPVLIPATSQKVIIGRANRWVVQGQKMGATAQDNKMRITCQGKDRDCFFFSFFFFQFFSISNFFLSLFSLFCYYLNLKI